MTLLRNTDIDTILISNTIGDGSVDYATLCSSNLINPWSKYKPVIYPYEGPQDIRVYDPYWYRSTSQNNGNCGINIPSGTVLSSVFAMLRNGVPLWNYIPPTGGSSSPYRLSDFRGYNHHAQPPFYIPPMASKYFYYGTGSVIGVNMNETIAQPGELTLDDLGNNPNLRRMYAGAAIAKQGASIMQYLTESMSIEAGGGGGVEIPMSGITGLSNGMYEVVMLLATNPKTSFSGVDVDNMLIPLMGGYFIIEIVTSTISVFIQGEKVGSQYEPSVNWKIILTNVSSTSLNLSTCSVWIRYADNDITDPMEDGENSILIGTITVPANGTYTREGTFEGAMSQLNRQGKVYFRNSTNTSWNNDSYLLDRE
jgi:hypothetical protein